MKMLNLTLPEFAFLDANHHQGDVLNARTVIIHIRTHTMMEALAWEDMLEIQLNTTTHEFTYTNSHDIIEHHILALHYSLAPEHDIPDIMQKTAHWYREYLAWEDANIMSDDKATSN